MKIIKNSKYYLIIPLLIAIGFSNKVSAQEYFVFHLKSGNEIIGNAFLDTLTNQYVIETLNGEKLKLDPSKVVKDSHGLFITNYERILLPPRRIIPPVEIDTCRIYSFINIGAKGVTHYVKDFSFGGEANLGIRWGDFNFGVGGGLWYLKDEYRYPVFLYIQKYLMNSCVRPFVIADVGYIFDKYTFDDKIKPSLKNVTKASPKFANLGLGIDIPVSTKFDLTIDAGYRYITIARDAGAASCNGLVPTIGYSELHAGYLRLGITF